MRLSGYFYKFEFEKEMIVRLEKVGVKLSITEPTSNLTESETLITFVKMAVDMLCLP